LLIGNPKKPSRNNTSLKESTFQES